MTFHSSAARVLAALSTGTMLFLAGGQPVLASGFTSNGAALIYLNDDGTARANALVMENGYYYHTDASGAMVNGWVSENGKSYLFDGYGRLVAGGATPDGKVVDGTGALIGTIGVDASCIRSVAADGAFYIYDIDPTPEDDTDPENDTQVTLPAAQEIYAADGTAASIAATEQAPADTAAQDAYTQAEREEVVQYALSLVGTPYVWGGESAGGLDCSGLIRLVYRDTLGLSLLHYTDYQAASGTAVSLSNLLPGDICCYDWEGDGHIDHVGIYIGDGKVVEAGSGSGKVVVTGINMMNQAPVICRDVISR
ncbi:MAG: NlpC/P60 family protein [Lachnospiraceae bacterium]